MLLITALHQHMPSLKLLMICSKAGFILIPLMVWLQLLEKCLEQVYDV